MAKLNQPRLNVAVSDLFACRHCSVENDAARAVVLEMQEKLENLQDELNNKLRMIKRLRAQIDGELPNHRHYKEAISVLEHWRETCSPRAREIQGGDRLKNVLARLNAGYSVDELKNAATGYMAKPYVVSGRRAAHGPKDCLRVDAELIYRDPEHVDMGLRFFEQGQMQRGALEKRDLPPVASEPELSPIGQAALRYAQAGWLVFPCHTDEKTPATIHGLLNASVDPVRITNYWLQKPEANVAIRTGAESGLVVLDVDGEEGMDTLRQLEKENGPLPKTPSIITPRGGQHYYFRHPGQEVRNTQGVPGPGLDIRGDGGYVLAPPSHVKGRRYEVEIGYEDGARLQEMPAWLLARIKAHQSHSTGRVDPAVWEGMVKRGVREGERNGSLTRLCGYLLNHLPDRGVVEGILLNVNRERCVPPLRDAEVVRIVDSIMRTRQRAA